MSKRYRARGGERAHVEAVQLLWSTWNEMCEHLAVGAPGGPRVEGCYVTRDGPAAITDDTNGRIGLKLTDVLGGTLMAVQGDWIVRVLAGSRRVVFGEARALFDDLYALDQETFERLFEPDASTAFEVDWSKYPKLAGAFVHRPRENIYWEELRALLVEARADAVRFVEDVKVEELARARKEALRTLVVPLHDEDGTIDFRDAEDGHSHHYVPKSLLEDSRAHVRQLEEALIKHRDDGVSGG